MFVVTVKPEFLETLSGFKLFDYSNSKNRCWICVVDFNGKVLGILSYLDEKWASNNNFYTLCIVESALKHKGISKLLMNKLFSYGFEVRNGYFKPDGKLYLEHQITKHNERVKNENS